MSNSTLQTQYEITLSGKSTTFTNSEESVILKLMGFPDARAFIRGWYSDEEPPSDRLEITNLVRRAIAFGRGRG